ncbi:MAG: DNA-processing protein DprA [Thermoleophilaceae bacterium]
MTDPCANCLRRSHLLAHLAPRIADLLTRKRGRVVPGMLGLADEELIAAVAGAHGAEARRFLQTFDATAARRALERIGVHAACAHGSAYPARLRDLGDPPATLFWVGSRDRLASLTREPAVAVVGARRASQYGLEVGYSLGRGLGAAGITVVSGMALGVDAAAHRGALDAGGPALAVLACGPELAYPRVNRGLHGRLVATGAVVSEQPPGQRALRWSFPARNRIMAALVELVVVVEAADHSGSLITADLASELGRSVAAVPGRITHRGTAGSNRLLKEGAVLTRGTEDLLDELLGPGATAPAGADAALEGLGPSELSVLEQVEAGRGGPDALGLELRLSAAAIRAALGRLEAVGLVVRGALGAYERTAR